MKRYRFFILVLSCTYFSCNSLIAQNTVIDSLLTLLKTTKEDTNKVNILNRLSVEYNSDGNYDNAVLYGNNALKVARKINFLKGTIKAFDNLGNAYDDHGNTKEALDYFTTALNIKKEIGNKKDIAYSYNVIGIVNTEQGKYAEALKNWYEALRINTEINNKKGITKNYNNIASIYLTQGEYSKALNNYYYSLKIAQELKDEKEIANAYLNIGTSYWRQGNYTEALNSELSALKINERLGNKRGVADNCNSIGLIHYEQGNYSEALKNLLVSLKTNEELNNKSDVARININIGIVLLEQGKYSEALKYQLNSLNIHKQLEDINGMAFNFSNIGRIYFKLGNNEEALKNFNSALKINQESDDKGEISNSLLNIGDIYIKQKKHAEAQSVIKKAFLIANEIGNKDRIKESYLALAVLDSAQGSWKNAYNNFKSYLIYRDSLKNEENTKKLVQSQMQYEFDKKQTEQRIKQENKDAIVTLEKRKQSVIIMSVSVGLLLVIAFSTLLFNRFRVTVKQKKIIEIQKKEVETQKEIVEEKNKQVTDSINYAKRIQKAILPSAKIIEQHLPDSFVFYLPKDIVAGDFYWLEKTENAILFAACDCTGHGVPGAMVSVVCYNALNRSVREFGLTNPASVLDKTAQLVIENFAESEDEIKDGMDLSLCTFNIDSNTLEYAGANNPLWLIRNGEIIETKADKQPIGMHENIQPFTNHQFEALKGDVVYLFSDGFADQFGGETGRKKLTKKRFKEFLLTIKELNMKEQGKRLEEFFYDYKKDIEQLDDILVMGIKI